MKDFIKSLQRPDNEPLIEAILKGYDAIFESKMMELQISPSARIIMSKNPIRNIIDTKQQDRSSINHNKASSYKPKGIWYGIGNEWL